MIHNHAKKKISLKIRDKMMIAFISISLFPIIVLSVVAFSVSKKALYSQTFAHLETIRDIKKNKLTLFLEDRKKDLSTLIDTIINQMPKNEGGDEYPIHHEYFCRFIQAYHYHNIYLISPEGAILYSALEKTKNGLINVNDPENPLSSIYHKTKRSLSMSFVDFRQLIENQPPYAFAGAPVIQQNKIKMIVVLQIPYEQVNDIMAVRKNLQKTMEIYLVGPEKLLRSDSMLEPETYSVSNSFKHPEEKRIDTCASNQALSGKTGTIVSEDYRGTTVLSAYTPLQVMDTSWAIIAKSDRDEALSTLHVFSVIIFFSAVISIAIIIRLYFFVSRLLTLPIIKLKNAAEKIKAHDYNINVNIQSNDELMLLAEVFNGMITTIRDNDIALEQQIKLLKKAETEARESEERFRALVETTSDWIWEIDRKKRYTYVSPRVRDILGYEPEEVLGKNPFDFMNKKEKKRIQKKFDLLFAARKPFNNLENICIHKNGNPTIMESSGVPFFDENNRLLGYRGVDRDISQRKKNKAELLLTESVFTNTIEGIAITDRNCTIQKINKAFTDITGYAAEEVIGKNPRILESNMQSPEFYEKIRTELRNIGQWSGEIWSRRKNGKPHPEWLSVSTIKNKAGRIENLIFLFHDISDKKQKEEQLQFLAFHDPLTKLPNRQLFYDRAGISLNSAKRSGDKMALLYMDIDNFKNINDSYGHPFGDKFLCSVKERIASICRNCDTFARYGGDEFVIILNNIPGSREAMLFSNRIINLFKEPLNIMQEKIYSSISIGLAVFPDDGGDIITLEKNADMALYEAKREGKRRSFLFQPTLQKKMMRKTEIESMLRKSINDFSSFFLLYQPKVDIQNNKIYGVEALLRWKPHDSLVSPVEFIPIAEESNMVISLGKSLIYRAMSDMKRIHDAGHDALVLSINLSAKQFNDENFFDIIENALLTTGYNRRKLIFEITESIPMTDVDKSIKIMQKIRSMGMGLSIDDFGTGYSSLSYLKRFPLQELKIDRSFITNISRDKNDAAIARTILDMAINLNFQVVAEGVDSREQLLFLKENGCHLIQGFLFFKPMSPDELLTELQKGEKLSENIALKYA